LSDKYNRTHTLEFRETFDKHTTELELFNGNPVFGIGLFVPCVITTVDTNSECKTKNIIWYENDEKWIVNSFDDVTIHGNHWDPLVKDFQNKILEFCKKNGNISCHLIHASNIDSKKYQIQVAGVRGNILSKGPQLISDGFYTFVQKNPEDNKGIRNITLPEKTVLEVDSQKSQNSLLFYLQTDFARLCLSLLKINQQFLYETTLVPWMDFTRSWTDDELFSELGYHKGHAIREYAKKFLPDYYNLYPNGKTY